MEQPVDPPKTMYEGPPRRRRTDESVPSSPLLLIGGLVVIAGLSGYLYLRAHPDLPLKARVDQLIATIQSPFDTLKEHLQLPSALRTSATHHNQAASHPPAPTAKSAKSPSKLPKNRKSAATPSVPLSPEHQTTLLLVNGERVVGELLRETPNDVIMRWDYGEASFKRSEIRQLIKPVVTPTGAASSNNVTLYLKNGGVVTGTLVHELPQEIILRFDYGEVSFQRSEIDQVVKAGVTDTAKPITMPWEGEHRRNPWPYHHDVVVKLLKGTVVDAELTRVTPTALILTQTLDGGGQIEHTIKRSDVEELLFRPIRNERSEQIAQNLQKIFPKMQAYEEGMFTIVTDSAPPVVKEYRRTIRELATDWYLAFFPLVKTRHPSVQQHIVVFENWDSYIEYAATDGMPGWIAVGYFQPEQEVLYCFNMLGERFAQLLYDVYLGQFRQARDRVSAQIKGSRYEEAIEGQLSEFLQKLETAHAMVRQTYQQVSIDVLRHELTHGLFHSWHLQGLVLSKVSGATADELEKKRKYLQSGSIEEKRKLLEELLSQRTKEEHPDIRAANAWFVEGLAGYMEPSPVGDLNHERLAEIQEARGKQQILPLEFLNTFRMGSFLGMATQSALYAYAQSWAFCHFLLHAYPDGFLAYLERLAREQPSSEVNTLPWLLQALGKEQRPLEQEFLVYLDQFPHEDPVWLKRMQGFLDLRNELTATVHRLWGG